MGIFGIEFRGSAPQLQNTVRVETAAGRTAQEMAGKFEGTPAARVFNSVAEESFGNAGAAQQEINTQLQLGGVKVGK